MSLFGLHFVNVAKTILLLQSLCGVQSASVNYARKKGVRLQMLCDLGSVFANYAKIEGLRLQMLCVVPFAAYWLQRFFSEPESNTKCVT